jgi:hypothetical protein
MKKFQLALGAILVSAGFVSCKDEAKETAEHNVDHYVTFVDSVGNLDAAERAANWEAIANEYQARLAEAEAALTTLENEEAAKNKVEESKTKFESVKTEAENEQAKAEANATPSGSGLADTLFGPGMIVGNDMTFAWVNKDNILSVYTKFYETYDANKDNYSRQDLDKIKAWYEALDNRKNTVEKEGLSSEDNGKIARIKTKFAPSFKWERMTAKGDENEEAKDKAE